MIAFSLGRHHYRNVVAMDQFKIWRRFIKAYYWKVPAVPAMKEHFQPGRASNLWEWIKNKVFLLFITSDPRKADLLFSHRGKNPKVRVCYVLYKEEIFSDSMVALWSATCQILIFRLLLVISWMLIINPHSPTEMTNMERKGSELTLMSFNKSKDTFSSWHTHYEKKLRMLQVLFTYCLFSFKKLDIFSF